MDVDYRSIYLIVLGIVAFSGLVLAGCNTVSRSRSTTVLAKASDATVYTGSEFNYLIGTESSTFISLGNRDVLSAVEWQRFRSQRVARNSAAARVDIAIRDQTNTPALDFYNIETASAGDAARILADKSLTAEQKAPLITQLRDNYREMPETYSRLVRHGVDTISQQAVYHYFPQITFDLTSVITSLDPLDRFDYVAAAIRLVPAQAPVPAPADRREFVRFINFSPKAADLFDFTLGQFKQSASLTAGSTVGRKSTTSDATASGPPNAQSTIGTGGEFNLGGSATGTLSDEMTRDLKASLEARSAGILEEGQLFLVELRSNDQKRIAGTYTYNIMLEVPSILERTDLPAGTIWRSTPVASCVDAEIRLVGIVRHVKQTGKTGFLKRVAEPLNDVTIREVVLRDVRVRLWTFNDAPLATVYSSGGITVYTNRDDASFTVYDAATHEWLAHGTGREAKLAVSPKDTHRRNVKVVFDPVFPSAADELVADEVRVSLGTDSMSVVGTYRHFKQEGTHAK